MQAQQAGEDRPCHVRVIPAAACAPPSMTIITLAYPLLSCLDCALCCGNIDFVSATFVTHIHACGAELAGMGLLQVSPSLVGEGGGVLSGAVALKARRVAHARQEPALCGLALAPLQERCHLRTAAPRHSFQCLTPDGRAQCVPRLLPSHSPSSQGSTLSQATMSLLRSRVSHLKVAINDIIGGLNRICTRVACSHAHLQRKVPLHERLVQRSQGGAGQPREALRQLPHQVLRVPQPA